MKKVLCIGESTYDINMILENFPIENKKFKIKKIVECGGGPSSNAAYLLSSWGIETYFVGAVGNDIYGSKIREELHNVGVKLDFLEISNEYNTIKSYIIVNEENASRTILKYKDENFKYSANDIPSKADYILVDGSEKQIALKEIRDNPNAISVLDAGNFNESVVLLSRVVDYIIASKDFVESYTNIKIDINNPTSLSKIFHILSQSIKGLIVITLGENGCIYKEENTIKLMPGLEVNAVDTTGAGDVFHGAFVYGLLKGYDYEEIMKLANIAGALSVEKIGGRYSIPSLETVLNIYDKIR